MNCSTHDSNIDCLPKAVLEQILWRVVDWSGAAANSYVQEKLPREIGEMSLVSHAWREIAREHVRLIHVEPTATADALEGILGRYTNVTRVVLHGSAHLLKPLALHCPKLERLHFVFAGVTDKGDRTLHTGDLLNDSIELSFPLLREMLLHFHRKDNGEEQWYVAILKALGAASPGLQDLALVGVESEYFNLSAGPIRTAFVELILSSASLDTLRFRNISESYHSIDPLWEAVAARGPAVSVRQLVVNNPPSRYNSLVSLTPETFPNLEDVSFLGLLSECLTVSPFQKVQRLKIGHLNTPVRKCLDLPNAFPALLYLHVGVQDRELLEALLSVSSLCGRLETLVVRLFTSFGWESTSSVDIFINERYPFSALVRLKIEGVFLRRKHMLAFASPVRFSKLRVLWLKDCSFLMHNLTDAVSSAEALDTLVVVHGERGKLRRNSFRDEVHGAILKGRREGLQGKPLSISEEAAAWVSGEEKWANGRDYDKMLSGNYDCSHPCLPQKERRALRRSLEEEGVHFMSPEECKAVHEPFELVI
eukprot:TRINITY_DN1394_c0_g1_i1.p1 TRINITY_DN1394_c0_g1~~TRINITY_DN1394_c0_g1_i1.p1  ORF type:complete len:536 (-),score=49.62 TRINITY_DN1394_c0_g1_i1:2061-3668(-)